MINIELLNNFRYPTSTPSIYNEEVDTALELAGKTAYKMNETITAVTKFAEDTNLDIETFKSVINIAIATTNNDNSTFKANINETIYNDISAKINDLSINGEIATLINETIFNSLNTNINSVNAGLANKANQSEVDLKATKEYVDTKFGSIGETRIFKGSCTGAELAGKTGMLVDDYWYISDLNTNKCYNGTSWVDIGNSLNKSDTTLQGNFILIPDSKLNSVCNLDCSTSKTAYISGKNLLAMFANTINGITVTIESDGSFTLNGTATTATILYFTCYIKYITTGTKIYRLAKYTGNYSGLPQLNVGYASADYLFTSNMTNGVIESMTTIKDGLINTSALYIGVGSTFTNFNMKVIYSLFPITDYEKNATLSLTIPSSITLTKPETTITSSDSTIITANYMYDSKSYVDTNISLVDEKITNINTLLKIYQGKRFFFIGDSITHLDITDRGWCKYFNAITLPSSYVNTSVNSATWRDNDNTSVYDGLPLSNGTGNNNTIGNQVQQIINNAYTKPDIIIIFAGTNDGNEILPDIESQFTVSGAIVPLTNVNRMTFAGSMRYAVETLRSLYPSTQIFICTPIQGVESMRTYATIKNKGNVIKDVASRLSIPVIDLQECGIYGINEVAGSTGIDLVDGLHPTISGAIKIGKYIARKVVDYLSF